MLLLLTEAICLSCSGFVATERTTQYSLEGYQQMTALKRVTTAEEVADTFVFLARNRAITGEHIRVDSGMSIV